LAKEVDEEDLESLLHKEERKPSMAVDRFHGDTKAKFPGDYGSQVTSCLYFVPVDSNIKLRKKLTIATTPIIIHAIPRKRNKRYSLQFGGRTNSNRIPIYIAIPAPPTPPNTPENVFCNVSSMPAMTTSSKKKLKSFVDLLV